jgi:hypothetical protein
VTIASRPSGNETGESIELILATAKAEYFSNRGWTLICPTGRLQGKPASRTTAIDIGAGAEPISKALLSFVRSVQRIR